MINIPHPKLIHSLLMAIGLVLMVGGILTGKNGAVVGGLIVAAVNAQQLIQRTKNERNR